LTIDLGWFGTPHPDRTLLHSSGLHGVEGFAGSAIQLSVLERLPRVPRNGALVLAHVLNPFGMAWLRRTNEGNVDLNRNFLGPGEAYAGSPEAYRVLDAFLNPPSAPSRDFFGLRAAALLVRFGRRTLMQAIAGGQYEYSRGLFFGGRRLEPGPVRFQRWVLDNLRTARRVLALDVHTGLGKSGEDTLLTDGIGSERLACELGRPVGRLGSDRNVAYRVRGGLQEMLARSLPGAEVEFVCQEFGTHRPIRILRALREENRWHHFGGGGVDHPAKNELKAAFFQDDRVWRGSVVERGRALFGRAVEKVFGE
jgi:hypothetical protein